MEQSRSWIAGPSFLLPYYPRLEELEPGIESPERVSPAKASGAFPFCPIFVIVRNRRRGQAVAPGRRALA